MFQKPSFLEQGKTDCP